MAAQEAQSILRETLRSVTWALPRAQGDPCLSGAGNGKWWLREGVR